MQCLTVDSFEKAGLDQLFNVISTNRDIPGEVEYISTMESKKWPFYGVQFHPEKNTFEHVNRKGHLEIPHHYEAIQVTQFFANFIVNEARKNKHRFNRTLEREALIYNYQPEYTSKATAYDQIYFFRSGSLSISPSLLSIVMLMPFALLSVVD